ncbi:MAG: serine hydrolase [Bacteroidota bacterium]
MQRILFLSVALLSIGYVQSQHYEFTYAAPESKGYSSDTLEQLAAHLETSGASSMLVLVDGEVIFEWGATSKKHLIHSMRKALLNSLYGIAIAKGQIDTSMTLRELNIDDLPPKLSENERNARVADLLKSRSGIYHSAAAVSNAMLKDFPARDAHAPGEHYYYNNWDFNALGAILEQQTGEKIYDLFNKQIAQPLGMHNYSGSYTVIDGEGEEDIIPDTDGLYQYEKSKSNFPADHFRMSARDLAIYGLLYLNYGNWQGEQVLPKAWIDTSTKPYCVYDPKYGNAYGMLWRVRVPGENTKRNSFYHTGVGIHMLGIYPDAGLVLVHRVDTEKAYDYNQGDFYKMIGLVFDAKLK